MWGSCVLASEYLMTCTCLFLCLSFCLFVCFSHRCWQCSLRLVSMMCCTSLSLGSHFSTVSLTLCFFLLTLDKHKMLSHQPHSIAVSALDCGLEGLWFDFESYQRHVGFFSPNWLLPRAGCAMGPVGRLRPRSWASSASRMHLRVLL